MPSRRPIRCLIIDDEAPARRVVAKYLSDIGGYEILAECRNAFEAMEAIQEYQPQLIFLDINMPKLSGLKLLETLSDPPQVIITTAYREYAVEGFEMNVVDYLHKPFSLQRFMQALNKVQSRLSASGPNSPEGDEIRSEEGFIFIKHEGEVIRVDIQDIDFVEAVGDYVHIVTVKAKYLSHLSMKKMLLLLEAHKFIRVHKSYIINLRKVSSISGNTIFLRSKGIPIGANYRSDFMSVIKSYMA